jgi:glycosyltransferase involved in cell wall biosynthesis
MVTLPVPERFAGLKKSIGDFLQQSHSEKELVVVMNGGDITGRQMIATHVSDLQQPMVRLVDVPGLLTLGALRNISLAEAHGEYFCHWDDDDRHHPQRLALQLRDLRASDKQALCLEEVMQYFPHERKMYCLNWRATEAKSFPPSLLLHKSVELRYPENGEQARRGEDLVVLRQLAAQGGYHVLAGAPHLILYVSHGQNTWSLDHHRMLARQLGLSKGLLIRRETKLREALQPFSDFLGNATVYGSNGLAFTL